MPIPLAVCHREPTTVPYYRYNLSSFRHHIGTVIWKTDPACCILVAMHMHNKSKIGPELICGTFVLMYKPSNLNSHTALHCI
jgi:hypothetical protein